MRGRLISIKPSANVGIALFKLELIAVDRPWNELTQDNILAAGAIEARKT